MPEPFHALGSFNALGPKVVDLDGRRSCSRSLCKVVVSECLMVSIGWGQSGTAGNMYPMTLECQEDDMQLLTLLTTASGIRGSSCMAARLSIKTQKPFNYVCYKCREQHSIQMSVAPIVFEVPTVRELLSDLLMPMVSLCTAAAEAASPILGNVVHLKMMSTTVGRVSCSKGVTNDSKAAMKIQASSFYELSGVGTSCWNEITIKSMPILLEK
jgi:hypothetical protein